LNCINFTLNLKPKMQFLDRHHHPGRFVLAENARVHHINLLPQGNIRNIQCRLDHPVQPTASELEDGFHVVQRLFGLLFNGTQLFLASLWIDRQLAWWVMASMS